MIFSVILVLILLIFTAIIKMCRRLLYNDFVIDADDEAFIKQIEKVAKTFRMPLKHGKGIDIRVFKSYIKKAHRIIIKKIQRKENLFEYEKWLYDNYYIFIRMLNRSIFDSFYTLPHTEDGVPRVVTLARTIVAFSNCKVSEHRVNIAINAVNKVTPLTIFEIGVFDNALAYALLEKVANISRKCVYYQKMFKRAVKAKNLTKKYLKSNLYAYYTIKSNPKLAEKLKTYLDKNEIEYDKIDYVFSTLIIENNILTANMVESLQKLNESTKNIHMLLPVCALLEKDEVYKNMDTSTKFLYLNEISKLSDKINISEKEFARRLLEFQKIKDMHFGILLFNHQRETLVYAKKQHSLMLKEKKPIAEYVYVISALFISAVASCLLAFLTRSWVLGIITAIILFFTLIKVTVNLINGILRFFLKPTKVFRMNYSGIPNNAKAMVIVPVFIPDEAELYKNIKHIEEIASVNSDKNCEFVLLIDFKPSNLEVDENDLNLINVLKTELLGKTNISAVVRKRSKIGDKFMGYERKRGAVEAFNEFLVTSDNKDIAYQTKQFDMPKFCIVLDADNIISPQSVLRLVNTALHPINEKYDLLAFEGRYNMYSINTAYSKQFLRDSGFENYPEYSSFYFNLTGRGIFQGKGIYNLENFHNKLNKCLPENKVLSHDIIEGAILNTGIAGEVTYEDAPSNFVSDNARKTRWMRGDIQLLPFINFTKKCDENKKIPLIYRFIIYFNAISILYQPLTFTLLLLFIFTNNLPILYFSSGLLAFELISNIFYTTIGVLQKRRLLYIIKDILYYLFAFCINLFLLPYFALNQLYVFISTVYKMLITKKGLLNWKTFSIAEGEKNNGVYIKMFAPTIVLMTILIALSYLTSYFWYIVIYFAFMVLFLIIITVLGIPPRRKEYKNDELLTLAKKTYKYFCDFEFDGLVADNYQQYPKKDCTYTTSPTNIGFSILSHISASALNIIEKDEAEKKVLIILKAVESLEKWNGHLFNWYDIKSKQPLEPYFVSSVDSGNFIASLLVAKGFFGEKIATLVDDYIKNVNFNALFDDSRQQFFIGFNKNTNQYEGHYDNLISEARLLAYIGIAFGINVSSWNSLSRDVSKAYGNTLMSWSGTVFEYLMAELFLDTPKKSLLGTTSKNSVKIFRRVKCRKLWGISESGYFKFDNLNNYQYYAFGIDNLSLRSEINRCVISPYSTFLAMPFDLKKSIKNLKLLKLSEMENEYGYFEALDLIGSPRIVLEYMAHHQGMIMCSIANMLSNNVIKNSFNKNANINGAKTLLCEKQIETWSEGHKKNKFIYENTCPENYVNHIDKYNLKPTFNILKSGNYSVVIDDFGRGFSKWNDIYLNRFRQDMYADYGGFFYVIDKASNKCISPTFAPLNEEGDFKVKFSKNECVFENENLALNVFAPDFFNGEMRKLTIKNDTNETKIYKIAYYTELSLNTLDGDYSHPAFNNLFIETELTEDTIIAKRKYLTENKRLYSAFIVKGVNKIRHITNRFNFIGRGHNLNNPIALSENKAKADDIGEVIEPCLAFVGEVTVMPNSSYEIDVIITVCDNYDRLNVEIKRAKSPHFSEFIKKIPYIVENNNTLMLNADYTKLLQNIVGKLIYEPYDTQKLINACKNHTNFIKFSNYFSKKILLTKFESGNGESLQQKSLLQKILNSAGLYVSLIISYTEQDSYFEPIKKEIIKSIAGGIIGQDVFIIEESTIAYDELSKMAFYAFTPIDDEKQIGTVKKLSKLDKIEKPIESNALISGEGYFNEQGYNVIPFSFRTMLPYSNVICGEYGGTLVTDTGGYTYYENSRENKLTTWSNDAVLDTPSEWLHFVATDFSIRLNGDTNAKVIHTLGETIIISQVENFNAYTKQYIIDNGKHKIYEVSLLADNDITGKLILNLDLVLGWKEKPDYIMYTVENEVLKAVNIVNGSKIALKVFGGNYILNKNELYSRTSKRVPNCCNFSMYNPAFSAFYDVDIKKGQTKTFYFLISGANDNIENFDTKKINEGKTNSLKYFKNLNKFTINSNNLYLDTLFNDWLMYQVVSCRINGKTAFYQAGGAIGFRDQLQDSLALIYSDSEKAKKLILEIAKHTYIEGDVMHWWHYEKHGVRTRISDDRLFLPYVVTEYIEKTGDSSILDIKLPYLFSDPLAENEKSRYENPEYTVNPESLLMHLERIIESAYRIGENGLLLIDGGDWNDALDEVGDSKKGESVWLTMFYYDVLNRMQRFYNGHERMLWVNRMGNIKEAIEKTFTGKQYKRLFTKEGEWLGDGKSEIMNIDIISQAWASLSSACSKKNVNIALNTAQDKLFDEKHGLIKLLWPPFNEKKYYGYISSYPFGMRENGGQYTHGAIWFIMALINEGKVDEAFDLFCAINPVEKGANIDMVKVYKGEPYVLPADIYTNPLCFGRAGWTWYTGSASWCYKMIIEGFLGIRLKNGNLEINPNLPNKLPRVEVQYRYKNSVYNITLVKNGKKGFYENGIEIKNGNIIKLSDNCIRHFEVFCC